MKLRTYIRNLFTRPSRKTLLAEIAQLTEWNRDWQSYGADLEAQLSDMQQQRDQYDGIARNLANRFSALELPAVQTVDEPSTAIYQTLEQPSSWEGLPSAAWPVLELEGASA